MADNRDGADASGSSVLPPHILAAIVGDHSKEQKQDAYKKSLCNWWDEYSHRKRDEDHEYVADSLLFDKNDLPRMAPAPKEWEERQARLKEGGKGGAAKSSETSAPSK
ncbi:unnamed protein product [Pedinophyceae sp. YPF-701]|nr:unnamed protein product [Pedinophyceae sp. YPF-701]